MIKIVFSPKEHISIDQTYKGVFSVLNIRIHHLLMEAYGTMSLIDAALHEDFPIFINIAPPKTKEQSKGMGL